MKSVLKVGCVLSLMTFGCSNDSITNENQVQSLRFKTGGWPSTITDSTILVEIDRLNTDLRFIPEITINDIRIAVSENKYYLPLKIKNMNGTGFKYSVGFDKEKITGSIFVPGKINSFSCNSTLMNNRYTASLNQEKTNNYKFQWNPVKYANSYFIEFNSLKYSFKKVTSDTVLSLELKFDSSSFQTSLDEINGVIFERKFVQGNILITGRLKSEDDFDSTLVLSDKVSIYYDIKGYSNEYRFDIIKIPVDSVL